MDPSGERCPRMRLQLRRVRRTSVASPRQPISPSSIARQLRAVGECVLSTAPSGLLRVAYHRLLSFSQERSTSKVARFSKTLPVGNLELEPISPRLAELGSASPCSGSPHSVRGRKRRRVRFCGFHGPEKGRACDGPFFQARAREVKLRELRGDEVVAELQPIMQADYPLYGLFSYLDPPEWSQLQLLCRTHPVVMPFIENLSGYVECLHPGTQLLQRAQGGAQPAVMPMLAPLASVVIQLVSFYATFRANTNLCFNRFACRFVTGGLLGLGPAVLVALAVSAAAGDGETHDGGGEEDFEECAQKACHMALLFGRALAAHHIDLPPAPSGLGYVLQVHNISHAVLEACIAHINARHRSKAPITISMTLSSRSFFLSGYPSDLEALQALLRSLANYGFKFGTRFLPFSGPIYSELNAPAAAQLAAELRPHCFSSHELGLDVLSPADGKLLRNSTDLVQDVVNLLLLSPHCVTALHSAIPYKAGVLSFESTNVPNAIGGHNLVVNQLMLQTPYLKCVSQPYSFVHTRPDLGDLHPRNNTKDGRRAVLLKCAMMNEVLAQMGMEERCDLISSWLPLGLLVRRQTELLPLSMKNPRAGALCNTGRIESINSIRSASSPDAPGIFLPSPSSQAEFSPDLLKSLSDDIDHIAHSSTLYNVERIEALGETLTMVSPAGHEFLRQLSQLAGLSFPSSTLWRCPSVIYFVEYWSIMEHLGMYHTSPPLTPAPSPYAAMQRPGDVCPSHSDLILGTPGSHNSTAKDDGVSLPDSSSPRPRRPPPQIPNLAFTRTRQYAERSSTGPEPGVTESARTAPDSPGTAAQRRHIRDRMQFFYRGISTGRSHTTG